jgi:hypothetical protein
MASVDISGSSREIVVDRYVRVTPVGEKSHHLFGLTFADLEHDPSIGTQPSARVIDEAFDDVQSSLAREQRGLGLVIGNVDRQRISLGRCDVRRI